MPQEDGYDLFHLNDGPRQPAFDVVLRGYDRRQVEEAIAAVDANLAALVQDRDAAYSQAQAYAAQAQRLQGEIYFLHQQLAAIQGPAAEASAKISQMMQLARAEAE